MKKVLSLFLSSVVLVCSLTSFGMNVFAQQSGKYEYEVLDDSTAKITDYYGVVGDIVIPNVIDGYQVTEIEPVFYHQKQIDSVSIPKSVRSIGLNTFHGCMNLKSINVDVENEYYCSENGVLFNKEKSFLIQYPSACFMTSYHVPESVTKINNDAFSNTRNLVDLIIPKSVESIRFNCFYDAGIKDLYYQGSEEEWKHVFPYDELKNVSLHFNSDGPCTEHDYQLVVNQSPTCIAAGKMTYECSVCGDTYTQIIPMANHSLETIVTKADCYDDGSVITKCSVCHEAIKSTVIYRAKSVALSAEQYVYDGKIKKPQVVVKDSRGTALKHQKDYTLSYSSDRKNVGQYTVTVRFTGNYSGRVTKQFTIRPKGSAVTSATPKSKSIAVKWNKQSVQTNGYEIQYALNNKFTGSKTVTVTDNSKTSKTISNLKSKKKYYVRIRTYKKVKSNGVYKKIYSSWSKYKTVTVK